MRASRAFVLLLAGSVLSSTALAGTDLVLSDGYVGDVYFHDAALNSDVFFKSMEQAADGTHYATILNNPSRTNSRLVMLDIAAGTSTTLQQNNPFYSPTDMLIREGHGIIGDELLVADLNITTSSICCGGMIFSVDPAAPADITVYEENTASDNPAYLNIPDAGNATWDDGLYFLDLYGGSGRPATLARHNPDGSLDTLYAVNETLRHFDFGTGGDWGDEIYIGTGDGSIDTIDSTGGVAQFTDLGTATNVLFLKLDRSGSFGGDLFAASANALYRVGADGSQEVVATGFDGQLRDIDFSLDGQTLLITDNTTIYALSEGGGTVDTDGDGVTDDEDAFPDDATEWADTDGDGTGDNADAFPDDATETVDTDGDGVGDNTDACFGFPNDDTDSDGVCDSDDVCPTDATDADADADNVCDVEDLCVGSDNVDSDGDQVCDSIDACEGNDATGDNDLDLICDGSDNCPDDANADQADADADDIGDACEADSDADGIIDDDDNCVDAANSDQSDLDDDGAGDVCDDDDDGDGVADDVDVCPFYADADQTDTDGDGLGDACDGDDDGDGVSDDEDVCPGTALDAPFDAQGCSGEQAIELECGTPEDYGWRRSGQYISCVVKESRAAKRAGLVTKQERAWLIRRAVVETWLQRYIRRIRRWC